MKKKDLKSGMVLVIRRGERRLVLLNTDEGDTTCQEMPSEHKCTVRHIDYYSLSKWDDDLNCISNIGDGIDVIEVYDRYGNILWKRENPKPIVTLDGVEYSEDTLRSIIKKATS